MEQRTTQPQDERPAFYTSWVERARRAKDSPFYYTYWPLVSSFLFLAAIIALTLLLKLFVTDEFITTPVEEAGEANADSEAKGVGEREWRAWIATTSLGLSLAILLAIHGWVRLRRLPTQLPDEAKITEEVMRVHGRMAMLWVIVLAVTVSLLVSDPRKWPQAMEVRLLIVSTIGVFCAAPWVAITWLCHQATWPYWLKPHELMAAQTGAAGSASTQAPSIQASSTHGTGAAAVDAQIAVLQQIWSHIVGVALAFSGLVAVALIPTGALRNLYLSQATDDKDSLRASFPSSDVLLYGGLWSLVAGLVVIPLVFSWRAAAQSAVDKRYPPNSTTADKPGDVTARGALQSMLNLNSGILRNPLTVLTIATPLVTAAIAAFVPEIGGP